MKNTKFILAIFDYKMDEKYENNDFIQSCMVYFRTKIFRNKSVQLSKRMLLIRVFESDLNSYPYTENIIEDAIYEVIQSDHKWFFDTNPLIVQCIAVDPANIPTITSNFANEIIYLEDRIS